MLQNSQNTQVCWMVKLLAIWPWMMVTVFWSDHLANLYRFKLPGWVVDQSVCNDWWSHGGNTNFHFCLSPKSSSLTWFSINSNYHALMTCNRQHASGIKNWQYMWMRRQCIFWFDHRTMLHGTYKLSRRLLGLWLSIGTQTLIMHICRISSVLKKRDTNLLVRTIHVFDNDATSHWYLQRHHRYHQLLPTLLQHLAKQQDPKICPLSHNRTVDETIAEWKTIGCETQKIIPRISSKA